MREHGRRRGEGDLMLAGSSAIENTDTESLHTISIPRRVC
jgi:hypothetical protein